MRIYTIETTMPDASKFEPRPELDAIFRLRVNGKLKRIAFTAEEAAELQRNGPNIGRSALEELFSSIPFDPRLAMLRRFPRAETHRLPDPQSAPTELAWSPSPANPARS